MLSKYRTLILLLITVSVIGTGCTTTTKVAGMESEVSGQGAGYVYHYADSNAECSVSVTSLREVDAANVEIGPGCTLKGSAETLENRNYDLLIQMLGSKLPSLP